MGGPRYKPRGKKERIFRISRTVVIIGRSEKCELAFDDDQISRRHCRIICDTGSVILQDLKSRNGTFVNGSQIETQQVADGELIMVGSHFLVYLADA